MKQAITGLRSKRVLAAMSLCMMLQLTGFVIILPLFARRFESFGAGAEALGMSAMAYAFTSMLAAPFVGMLADRYGRRPIILVSLTAYVLAFSGYLFAISTWQLIAIRGLAGVFTAGLLPAMNSMVGDQAPESQRAQWLGIMNGGASAGWIIGPVLGGVLFDQFGYVVPFATSIIMAIGALLLAVFLIPETFTGPQNRAVPWFARGDGFRPLPVLRKYFLPMLVSFGVMFVWAFIEPQFMFYAYDQLNWTSSQLGLAMSAYGMACTIGEFGLGQLSDRLGRKPVLVLGLVLFSAQFAGLVFFNDVAWIVVSFILAGFGNALYDPALSAYILDITLPEHTACIMGFKGTVGSLGNMLGPALVVLFIPVASPQTVFLMAFILVIILAIFSGFALNPAAEKVVLPLYSKNTLTHQGE